MLDSIIKLQQLTLTNYNTWYRSIVFLGLCDETKYNTHAQQDVTLPADATQDQALKHDLSKQTAMFTIEQSLPDEIRKRILSNHFANKTPFQLCNILKKLIDEHPSNNFSLLYAQLISLELQPGEDLTAYIDQHTELRDRLITHNYLGISEDKIAIDLI
eukprot:IDg3441t1